MVLRAISIGPDNYPNYVDLDRQLVDHMFGARSGVLSTSGAGAFAVTTAAGHQFSVAAGAAVLRDKTDPANRGAYFASNTAAALYSLPNVDTQPFIASVVLRAVDPQYESATGAVGARIDVVSGTPSGSPVPPSDATISGVTGTPGGWTRLANIRINTGDTGDVPGGQFTDARTWIAAAALPQTVRTLAGGGIPTVTSGGVLSWSGSFVVMPAVKSAAIAPDGRFLIARPANGTVIPFADGSGSVTVTATGVPMPTNPSTLWYRLPYGQAAASQASRFTITRGATDAAFAGGDGWVPVATWHDDGLGPATTWGNGAAADYWRAIAIDTANWQNNTAGWPLVQWRFQQPTMVQIAGVAELKSGGSSASNIITLPAGARPAVNWATSVPVLSSSGAQARLDIQTGGAVRCETSGFGAGTRIACSTTFPLGG